jgi:hypothetical protein
MLYTEFRKRMRTQQNKPASIEDRVLALEYGEEKTERHYGELKEQIEGFSDDIKAIKTAVIGSDMNGNNGIVQENKILKQKVFELEVKSIKYDLYFKQLATAIVLLSGGLITALLKLFIR